MILVKAYSGVTIDGIDTSRLTRWAGLTFVAWNGNWYSQDKTPREGRILDVTPTGSWTSVKQAFEYLKIHMNNGNLTSEVDVRMSGGSYTIDTTIVIDLPYPVVVQGLSYGTTYLVAAAGLTGKPMFNAISEAYFKMLIFDATTLSGYGTQVGEDAIQLNGSDKSYYEVKDIVFTGFYHAVHASNNVELWFFECDVYDSYDAGFYVQDTTNEGGLFVKLSEVDFNNNNIGVYFKQGKHSSVSLISGGYYNQSPSQVAINRDTVNFTEITNIFVTNNNWNGTGIFHKGFNFTRSDGRDANVMIKSNTGVADAQPHVKINVINNLTSTTCNGNTWTKVNLTTTSPVFGYITTKFTVNGNRVTYQSDYTDDCMMFISGNLNTGSNNTNIDVAIVKNGNSTTTYGQMTVRYQTATINFSTVVYLQNVKKNDYFEVWVRPASYAVITIQDLNWYTDSY